MIKMQGIYQIRNLIHSKIYIGSSVDIRLRWWSHANDLNKNSHRNKHLQRAWNKYGEESFVFEKLEDVNREQDILIREQWYLDNIVKWGFDYNIAKNASSPMLGRTHSPESIENMSGKNNGMWGRKHSPESKKKMSDTRNGTNNWMKGRRGSKHPMFGKKHSLETVAKKLGEKNWMFGKKHSPETKARISKSKMGGHHSPESRKKCLSLNRAREHTHQN